MIMDYTKLQSEFDLSVNIVSDSSYESVKTGYHK